MSFTRQSLTLRRTFAVHTTPTRTTEPEPQEGRDYPANREFDLWRGGTGGRPYSPWSATARPYHRE
jgi:hypothetical protein